MKEKIIVCKKFKSLEKFKSNFESLHSTFLKLLSDLEEDKSNIEKIYVESNMNFYKDGDKFFGVVDNVKNLNNEIIGFLKKLSDIYCDLEKEFSYIKEGVKNICDTIKEIEDKSEELEAKIEYIDLIE